MRARAFGIIRDTLNREKPSFHEPRGCNSKPVNPPGRQVQTLQFSVGRSICSTTMVSTGALVDSNHIPSCSRSAVKSEGPAINLLLLLIFRRLLDVIDDNYVHRSLLPFQLEAKLLFHRCEERRAKRVR